jgi:hypothetical protein
MAGTYGHMTLTVLSVSGRYMPVRDPAGRWPIARFPPATALPDYRALPFEPPREEARCRM